MSLEEAIEFMEQPDRDAELAEFIVGKVVLSFCSRYFAQFVRRDKLEIGHEPT